MSENLFVNGQDSVPKAMSAAESLKRSIRRALGQLPADWRDQMKAKNPYYKTDRGNTRLSNLRNGRVAPTVEEVELINAIAGV